MEEEKMNIDAKERRLSNYITLELFLPAIKFCIVQSIPGLVVYNGIANAVLGVFFVVLFLRNLSTIITRSGKYVLLTAIVLALTFLSALFYGSPNINNYTQALVDIVVISCTLFLTAVSVRDFDTLFDVLLRWSPVVIFASIFMVVCTSIIGVVGTAETSYNMSLSYYILIPSMVIIIGFIEKKKISYLALFLISLAVIVIMGSRGPMLCIGLFLLLYTIKTFRITLKSISVLAIGALCALIVFTNFESIATGIYQWLLSHNIDSRTLLKIIQGSLFDDSNRIHIIEDAMNIVKDNVFGIGFMGNLSTHNIAIENVLWFGIIIGMLLNVILFAFIVRTIIMKINLQDKRSILTTAFFCYAVPDALLNLTVWGKDMFWIYIAFIITAKTQKTLVRTKGLSFEDNSTYRL